MILSNREQLLLQLLLEQKEFRPASFFQKQLNVSPKTVYNNLTTLEKKLKDSGLAIKKVPRKGIFLSGSESAKQNGYRLLAKKETKLELFSPNYRKIFIFANYLFSVKPMHYQEFSEYFYISNQSIKKDVDEIVAFCRFHQVSTKMTTSGLKLTSVESAAQNVFKSFLEKYTDAKASENLLVSNLFDSKVLDLTKKFVSDMTQTIGHPVNNYSIESLKLSLRIFLSRLLIDKHIEKQEHLVFDELRRMKFYMIAVDFAEMIQQQLPVQFSDTDIQYVCSLLLAHGIEPFGQMDEPHESTTTNCTKQIIQKMSHMLNADLTQDKLLLQTLLAHIVPMIHRSKTGILLKNPLIKSIKKQYSTMYTLTKYAIGDLEERFQILLTEDEVSFLTIHFQLAFEKIKITNHILIVCQSGFATSELIFNRIKQTIAADTVLEIIPLSKLASTSLEAVDLIISTIPLDITAPPVIYISPLPTTEEIGRISAKISNLNENEKNFYSKKYQKTTLLQKYLDPTFLFVKKKFRTKKDVLDFLADDYLKKKLVTTKFKHSLFEREELGSTGLKTGVAIPHADPHTVKETKLAFLTLDAPITWGDTKIQLIVLLAIAEENMIEAKELIASIYGLFNSAEEIQWIVNSQTQEELYQRLLRGGN